MTYAKVTRLTASQGLRLGTAVVTHDAQVGVGHDTGLGGAGGGDGGHVQGVGCLGGTVEGVHGLDAERL